MKQTTEELEAIVEGAPKTANYISMMGYVLNELDDWYFWSPVKQKYVYLVLYDYEDSWDFQSLEDIREIIKLREEVEAKDKRIVELERQNKRHFVGYTNGCQIHYAKDESGSFYPDTDNECIIPLYMLDIHLHRLHGTPSKQASEVK